MCRLLSLMTSEQSYSKKKNIFSNWLEAWKESTKQDKTLSDVYHLPIEVSNHADGWGIITLGANDEKITYKNEASSFSPAFSFRTKSFTTFINSPFLQSNRQIVMTHARRASRGTPITYHQIQPLNIRMEKNSYQIHLSHNGSVNTQVVNSMLSKYNYSDKQLKEFSDTQILAKLIKEKMEVIDEINIANTKFWNEIIKEIIVTHEKQDKDFIMQLQILLLGVESQKLLVVAAIGEQSLKRMPYYELFIGKKDKSFVCCSSNVVNKFSERHNKNVWHIKPVRNKSLLEMTYESIKSYKL
jgi:predicted glutamine amidotransferase